ncbi:beta-glucosidase, partial [Thermococci archaeon]
AQLRSVWIYELLEDGRFSKEKAEKVLKHGIGQITRLAGASNFSPKETAKIANEIQHFLVENTRLGIPAIIHEECLSGFMANTATIFPEIIGLASSWNPELVEEVSSVIRRQMRAVGVHQGLAPVLDVARDPRWGRIEETFGEDPYLVACMGAHYVKGLQGDDISNGIIATVKHFVAHGFPEGGRNIAPVHVSERELREVFLYPFEVAIKHAGAKSIMHAYHEIDGVPCAASKKLLRKILREEWGFNGFVVSDYFGVKMLHTIHKVALNEQEAARIAIEAGIDLELPTVECYGQPLIELVKKGMVSEKLVEDAVARILRVKFRLGLFDDPYIDLAKVPKTLDDKKSRELALRAARESIILLKNDGILPLSKEIESVAVIGPNADDWRNMIGDYSYPAHIESTIEMAKRGLFGLHLPERIKLKSVPIVTVLEAIRKKVSPNTKVYYAKGCELTKRSDELLSEAIEKARKAKIVVLVVGERSGLTPNDLCGESRDRAHLTLPPAQEELVKAIYETGTPMIVILINGRPLAIEWIVERVPAIIEAWFPGEEGGRAIADVIFGDYNPGGKLPVTVPRTSGQIPLYYNHKPTGGFSHWWGDYVFTSAKPLFPFGHGLSYTKFEYSNLNIDPEETYPSGKVKVSFDLMNVGKMTGDEVVQLYIRDEFASVTRPIKELKGFKRVKLKPGEKKRIVFVLPVDLLAFYDEEMKLIIEPGEFEVMIGSSSEDIRLKGTFKVVGTRREVIGPLEYFSEVIIQ